VKTKSAGWPPSDFTFGGQTEIGQLDFIFSFTLGYAPTSQVIHFTLKVKMFTSMMIYISIYLKK